VDRYASIVRARQGSWRWPGRREGGSAGSKPGSDGAGIGGGTYDVRRSALRCRRTLRQAGCQRRRQQRGLPSHSRCRCHALVRYRAALAVPKRWFPPREPMRRPLSDDCIHGHCDILVKVHDTAGRAFRIRLPARDSG
jgi:hypothetical protein